MLENEPIYYNCRCRLHFAGSLDDIEFTGKLFFANRYKYANRKAVAECKLYHDLGFVDTLNMEN